MEKLFQLLRELIDHAVPQGNKAGELHGLLDEAVSAWHEDRDKYVVDPAKVSAPADAKTAKSSGAAKS